MFKKIIKCLSYNRRIKRIINRAVVKYNLPKYCTQTGKKIVYDIDITRSREYEKYTGKLISKTIKLTINGNNIFNRSYPFDKYLIFDRHGKCYCGSKEPKLEPQMIRRFN